MSKAGVGLVVLGLLLGVSVSVLFSHPLASAQTGYSECGFLTLPNASNGAELAGRPPEHPIRVPPGWTPIGGGQYVDRLPGVVVCR